MPLQSADAQYYLQKVETVCWMSNVESKNFCLFYLFILIYWGFINVIMVTPFLKSKNGSGECLPQCCITSSFKTVCKHLSSDINCCTVIKAQHLPPPPFLHGEGFQLLQYRRTSFFYFVFSLSDKCSTGNRLNCRHGCLAPRPFHDGATLISHAQKSLA